MENNMELLEVLGAYGMEKRVLNTQVYGNGHINDTNLIVYGDENDSEKIHKIILQRINTSIFKNPVELMDNIIMVTEWIENGIVKTGGDVNREVLRVVLTKEGRPYYKAISGNWYRAYYFIEDGLCLEQPRDEEDFYESGIAFGRFQGALADFPAEKLHETIPDFHNTSKRLMDLKSAIEEDTCGLVHTVREEIDFALSMEKEVTYCMERKKELPLRVTHNDTKLNNAMLDAKTRRALCVLDLDTVMPGYAMDDFGDSIRFGASTAAEDEKDLSKVTCDLSMFCAYAKGFIKGTQGRLSTEEILLFPLGAQIMTYECGIRFLMDYLQGNIYFKVAYPEHNLTRARNQFALVKDMDKKMDEMKQIMVEFAKI